MYSVSSKVYYGPNMVQVVSARVANCTVYNVQCTMYRVSSKVYYGPIMVHVVLACVANCTVYNVQPHRIQTLIAVASPGISVTASSSSSTSTSSSTVATGGVAVGPGYPHGGA